ncbi:MAG: preprotein translocase subunit YajC [Desulfovibrionaceae bacterium]|nr:preprotein translocase subunit YajC [Desulfovibrionaceae bacterium]
MFAQVAFAMGTPQAGAQATGGMGMLASFMPFILMFVIFWFLLIRPQQKRAKAHREMLEALKRGDKIVTSSGLLGTIVELTKDEVVLECGEAKLKMTRGAIAGLTVDQPKGEKPKKGDKAKNKDKDKDTKDESEQQ